MLEMLSVRLITWLGVWNVNLRELTVRTYVSPTCRPSKVKYPNELVDTLNGVSSELPVSTISALRIDIPSAVTTRPEIEACAAVGTRNSSPHPPAIWPTAPPCTRAKRLQVPFGFVLPKL